MAQQHATTSTKTSQARVDKTNFFVRYRKSESELRSVCMHYRMRDHNEEANSLTRRIMLKCLRNMLMFAPCQHPPPAPHHPAPRPAGQTYHWRLRSPTSEANDQMIQSQSRKLPRSTNTSTCHSYLILVRNANMMHMQIAYNLSPEIQRMLVWLLQVWDVIGPWVFM